MDRYEDYEKYTKEHDWIGICKLNDMSEKAIKFLNGRKELHSLHEHLLENETVFAFTHGGTLGVDANVSLVTLTNERFLFLEAAMFSKKIVRAQSIRLEDVQAVTAREELFQGALNIDLGARVVKVSYCFKQTASIVANIANKCIQDIKSKKNISSKIEEYHEETPLEKLEKLSKLHKMGALTDEEFNTEKQKLLAKI